MEEEIERQLDSKARKSNLTVANVKNILKVIFNKKEKLLGNIGYWTTQSENI